MEYLVIFRAGILFGVLSVITWAFVVVTSRQGNDKNIDDDIKQKIS